jgi:hypothetical protein
MTFREKLRAHLPLLAGGAARRNGFGVTLWMTGVGERGSGTTTHEAPLDIHRSPRIPWTTRVEERGQGATTHEALFGTLRIPLTIHHSPLTKWLIGGGQRHSSAGGFSLSFSCSPAGLE